MEKYLNNSFSNGKQASDGRIFYSLSPVGHRTVPGSHFQIAKLSVFVLDRLTKPGTVRPLTNRSPPLENFPIA